MRYLLILLILAAAGCSPQAMYVASDRLTYEAIAPEYVQYVQGDPYLTPAQKRRRERTVAAWGARLNEGEK